MPSHGAAPTCIRQPSLFSTSPPLLPLRSFSAHLKSLKKSGSQSFDTSPGTSLIFIAVDSSTAIDNEITEIVTISGTRIAGSCTYSRLDLHLSEVMSRCAKDISLAAQFAKEKVTKFRSWETSGNADPSDDSARGMVKKTRLCLRNCQQPMGRALNSHCAEMTLFMARTSV